MVTTNTLAQKSKNILTEDIISNFPENFEHMSNITIDIKMSTNVEIQYNSSKGDKHTKKFTIRTVDDNEKIIIRPKNHIGRNHIKLIENYGPFIIKR